MVFGEDGDVGAAGGCSADVSACAGEVVLEVCWLSC